MRQNRCTKKGLISRLRNVNNVKNFLNLKQRQIQAFVHILLGKKIIYIPLKEYMLYFKDQMNFNNVYIYIWRYPALRVIVVLHYSVTKNGDRIILCEMWSVSLYDVCTSERFWDIKVYSLHLSFFLAKFPTFSVNSCSFSFSPFFFEK